MKNLRKLLWIFVLVVLVGVSVYAQPKNGAIDDALPDVEGWTKDDGHFYDLPGAGYSLNYDSIVGGRITVYVYDGNHDSIPDGVESELVKAEIENAYDGIKNAIELGYYEKAEVLKNDVITLGGADGRMKALRMVLKLTQNGRDMTSEIYLFGWKNRFIKLRSTRAEEIEGLQNKAVTDLFAALDKAFSR